MDIQAEKKKFIAICRERFSKGLAKGFHVSGNFMDGNLQKRWLGWLECVRSRESEVPTRQEVENFLVRYHEEVWAAAADNENNLSKAVDYDEAGRELAKAFLSRFQ